MKRSPSFGRLALALCALAGTLARAQAVPQVIAFTGNLTNSGAPTTGTAAFRFELFDAATGGASPWFELQALPVTNGLVYADLGSVKPFTPVILNGAPLWLEVTVNTVRLSPRLPFRSVPFAMRAGVAATSERLGTLAPSDVPQLGGPNTFAGAVTAPDFRYTAPLAGVVYVDPTSCQRVANTVNFPPYQDTGVLHPGLGGNPYGPSVSLITGAAGSEFYCPFFLQRSPGAVVTLTGATLAGYDGSATGFIAAEIRSKLFGASDQGTVVSTVYSGTGPADLAATLVPPVTKAFPAFTLALGSNQIVWVRAFFGGAFDVNLLRFSGVQVTYTVDRP